ncbi:MAG: hypothetical protein LUE93_16810 [Bacteroides sp.]|nr:hypothetical protein [Bacteroides sp.]
MKIFRVLSMLLAATTLLTVSSCNDEENEEPDPEDNIVVNGVINPTGEQDFYIRENYHLKKGTYVMKGWCYVEEGYTLTIDPGTVIKGDKDTKAALIIKPGGKAIIQGTKEEPIIFTSAQAPGSRRPGDWGGLIICGKAKNNNGTMPIEGGPDVTHRGDNDDDNSGIYSYIRVEFAGYPFRTDKEINGITFGSVGRGTQADHLQVSYCNDDSFEWFGGSVNCKYLVSYHSWDDEFDTDNGFSGKLQFLLSVRHPKIADTSLSNGFESDNNKDGSTATPYTSPVFSNVTFIGPIGQDPDFANTTQYITAGDLNPNNGSNLGTFQAAMQIRRNSRLNCFNSVAVGYPVGLILDNDKGTSQTWATNRDLKLNNIVFAGMTITGSDINKSWEDAWSEDGKTSDPSRSSFSTQFFLAQEGNASYESISDLMLAQPNSLEPNASYGPLSGSPLLAKTTAELFSDALLNDSFFEKVDYIGAFKSNVVADDWTAGWCNFDPQNTVY